MNKQQMKLLYSAVLRRLFGIGIFRPGAKLLYKLHANRRILQYSPAQAEEKLLAISPRPSGSSINTTPLKEHNKYDVSVIIPFYNTEQFARDCIESVLSQNCDYKVEVILINDGSPDGCREILDSYGDRENVVVVHKENQGVSVARNVGIVMARGEYLMFVDSDDWLAKDAIQLLMDVAKKENADIAEGSHQTRTVDKKPIGTYLHEYSVDIQGKGMFGYPWGKVIRKTLFKDFCFPEGYWYEDSIFANLIHPVASTTVTIPDIVLYYRQNPKGQSFSTLNGNPKSMHSLYIVEDLLNTYDQLQLPLDESRRKQLLKQLGPHLIYRINWMDEESKQAAFAAARELAFRHHLLPAQKTGDYFYDEYCEALTESQYNRWKWAAILA